MKKDSKANHDQHDVIALMKQIELQQQQLDPNNKGLLNIDLKKRLADKYHAVELELRETTKHTKIATQTEQMNQLQFKKFFKRQFQNVKENYLLNEDEIEQKLATINLFEKFDADGSGALDAQELTTLYNEQGINISEEEIKKLYDDEGVLFTLPAFEEFSKDVQRLRHYRLTLSKMYHRLAAEAYQKSTRGFIPRTFDAMMLDFGNRVHRQELLEKFDELKELLIEKNPLNQTTSMIMEHASIMDQLFSNTAQSLKLMNSSENETFRAVRTKALKEKEIQRQLKQKFVQRIEAIK